MSLRVGILIYKNVEVLDFSAPYEVLTTANRVARKAQVPTTPFEVFTVAEGNSPVIARAGLSVNPDYSFKNHPAMDVLIVPGGVVDEEMNNVATLDWLRHVEPQTNVTSSICTGVFLLAQAGVVAEGAVTTHWEDILDLRVKFPALEVREGTRWIERGKYVTSAGISAGLDMSLHLVRRLGGSVLATQTARQLEYEWRS